MHADAQVFLTLFVMGTGRRSVRAIVNLRSLCEGLRPGAYQVDVVDIATDPAQARAHQLVAVPTLLVRDDGITRRFVGDLSDDAGVVQALRALRTGRATDD